MERQIRESDWKIFRELHCIALERFCERVLVEVEELVSQTKSTAHERYLEICERVLRRNKEMARAFDDVRRSTALFQLTLIHRHGLLTEDELAQFSPETLGAVKDLSDA